MVKFYRKSASLSALWVSSNDRLSDFYASSWQRGESPLPLLVVRLVLAACAVGILIWSLIEGASSYWLIYLTNWGVLLVAATMISGVGVSFAALFNRPNETTELPWFMSTYWVIFNISVPISIMITSLYWILLYNPDLLDMDVRAFWLDVTTHGLTSCIVLAELLASRTPVWLTHMYQPLCLGLWYTAFSGIYYAAGGTDPNGNSFIYEVLDWGQSRRAGIVVLGSVAALIVLYLLLWGLAICRDKLALNLVRTRSHDLPTVPADLPTV
ncbi:protein rolling stone-like [Anticarsia gemmatalis]|uniref:protein rolling stone-like n=1 Tax=Anticarsia gemmatalis TaxID=129554 RepID=UPI003F76A18E